MFTWYQLATKCFVFLTDVSSGTDWKSDFAASRWLTRGWTLQELIAPQVVEFYSTDGNLLGERSQLAPLISQITNIPELVLQGSRLLYECTIAERFSWARERQTQRKEDCVYALIGIFDVIMPVIYGEGETGAMRRLEQEIWKNCK